MSSVPGTRADEAGATPVIPRPASPLGLHLSPTSCRADAYAKESRVTHPDEVHRYIRDPRLEPGIDERRALGLGIQMMCCSPRQHDPPLVCLRVDLVDLYGDLIVGGDFTPGRQSSSKTRSHVPKTIDSPSILYMTGSAVGPYRLVKTRRPIPSSGSSAYALGLTQTLQHARGALTPGSGEAAPRGELRSASSSGIVPTLAVCPAMVGGRRGLPLDDLQA